METDDKPQPDAATDLVGQGATASESCMPQGLAEALRPLFWDCDFDALRLEQTPDFIIGRILARGSWDHVRFLREAVRDVRMRAVSIRLRRQNRPLQAEEAEITLGVTRGRLVFSVFLCWESVAFAMPRSKVRIP